MPSTSLLVYNCSQVAGSGCMALGAGLRSLPFFFPNLQPHFTLLCHLGSSLHFLPVQWCGWINMRVWLFIVAYKRYHCEKQEHGWTIDIRDCIFIKDTTAWKQEPGWTWWEDPSRWLLVLRLALSGFHRRFWCCDCNFQHCQHNPRFDSIFFDCKILPGENDSYIYQPDVFLCWGRFVSPFFIIMLWLISFIFLSLKKSFYLNASKEFHLSLNLFVTLRFVCCCI